MGPGDRTGQNTQDTEHRARDIGDRGQKTWVSVSVSGRRRRGVRVGVRRSYREETTLVDAMWMWSRPRVHESHKGPLVSVNKGVRHTSWSYI